MFARRKLGLISAAATALVALVAGPAAQATDHTAFSFSGATNALTPIPPSATMNTTGSYSFAGNVPNPTDPACSFSDDLGTNVVSTSNCTGTITSSGTYSNITCGTGSATGTATITSGNLAEQAGATANDSPFTTGYTITFAAGAGTLIVTSGSDSDGDGNARGGGSVVLTQLSGENCATTGATGFDVTGHVTATLG